MSLTLTYAVPGNDLSQLHDALRKAGIIPEYVEGSGDDVRLTLPDGTSAAAVATIVGAHIPQARYDPATRLARVRALRRRERVRGDYERAKTQAGGATTLAQLRDAVLTVLEARRT